jgi:putative membrane protein
MNTGATTMKMQRFKLSTCAMALAFSFGGALAQYSSPAQSSGSGSAGTSATGGRSAPQAQPGTGTRNAETKKDDQVARGDRKFIQEVAGSGMFEVQAAQLATKQASDPNVKSFAGTLVDAHTKANDELVKLANAKQVELPAAPPRAMRRDIEKLGKKQGQEFDRDFVREVGVKAHEKNIKTFEKASKDTKDPELKAFIDKTLPTLKEHLAMAQKLPQAGKQGGEQMGGKGGGDSSRMGASGSTPAGGSTGTGGGSGANKTGG